MPYAIQEALRRSSMNTAVIINDSDLAMINAGPPAGRADARMLLVNLVRDYNGLPIPPPVGSEYFNDGELATLLSMTCSERMALLEVLDHKRTPTCLEDLAIAWQGAPPPSRRAVEAMSVAEFMNHGDVKTAGGPSDTSGASGPISATAPFTVSEVPVVPIDESNDAGPLPPAPPGGDDGGDGGDDGDDDGNPDTGTPHDHRIDIVTNRNALRTLLNQH
eukprot:14636917-Heterocapsa_arctica.AAC.1